jgi:hypothetical protein
LKVFAWWPAVYGYPFEKATGSLKLDWHLLILLRLPKYPPAKVKNFLDGPGHFPEFREF